MTALLLGVIGVLLAAPVPAALGRMRWPFLAPRAGIVLWQSVALAAILAVVGAGLATALWLVTGPRLTAWRIVVHFAVLALTALVVVRLAWSVWHVARDTRRRRARHRDLVDLLGSAGGGVPDLRVLAEQTPIAYCLPGLRNSRVVVSSGALAALAPEELQAVLAHERAHVRARHDLVLEAFGALRRAFPRGPHGSMPQRGCEVMVELLADDAARREVGTEPLARALATLSRTGVPTGALGAGVADTTAQIRLRRLSDEQRHHRLAAGAAYLIALVVLVGPTVGLAVPWMLHSWHLLRG